MSPERELLQECYFFIDNKVTVSSKRLLDRIDKLLAQPEQEAVAWMYDSYEDGRRARYDCLTTTEDYVTNYGVSNIRPLYTSPPKREPMIDTKCPYPEETSGEYRDGFTDGILYAEKEHGIGE